MEDFGTQTNNVNTVLKELSDIKASLAVNTAETSNIKATIAEIKSDVKEIKNDYVSRRELRDSLTVLRDEIEPLRRFIYAIIAFLGFVVLGAIMNLVIKK